MNNNNFLKPTDEYRHYKALEEIEKNPKISQRALANKLEVAVGIANACIHTLIRKGLIKIRGENNRSITYHLTKKGILHKSGLALEWSKNTINFYRQARLEIKNKLEEYSKNGYKKLLMIGSDEINEIASIIASEANLEITTFEDINRLINSLNISNFDAIVLTDKINFDQIRNTILSWDIDIFDFETGLKVDNYDN